MIKIRQEIKLKVVFVIFSLVFLSNQGRTQSIFHLNEIVCNDASHTIDFYLSTYTKNKNGQLSGLVVPDPSLFTVTEKISTEINNLSIKSVSLLDLEVKNSTNILFLFDYSSSMLESGYVDAELIAKRILDANLSKITNIKVGWFNNEGSSGITDIVNYKELQEAKKDFNSSKNTDLVKGLSQSLDKIKTEGDPLVILIFTNGQSIFEKDISKLGAKIKDRGSNFFIYPIGIGEVRNESYLSQLPSFTPSLEDSHVNSLISDKVFSIIQDGKFESESNLRLSVNPTFDNAILGQEKREYTIAYHGTESYQYSKEMVNSSAIGKCDLRPIVEFSQRKTFFYGIGIVTTLLGLLWFVLPIYNRFHFKRNYVKRYETIKRDGITALDPNQLTPIKDDDLVVAIGKKVMLLDTWKHYRDSGQGEVSKDHAEFFENQLSLNFFSQKGGFQRLNWLWFGALGGFMAWCLNKLLNTINLQGVYNILKNMLDTPGQEVASAVHTSILSGICLGLGICTTLALVEEIGQSRKFSLLRIVLRSIIGALVAIPIFFLESYISASFLNFNYLGGLVGWTIFGTAIGIVVTTFSNIEVKNGLIGGFIAGVIAFHLYYILQHTPQIIDIISSDFAKMLGFIIYGGLLGLILFSVVAKLEDFELEYISPQAFNGQVKAISKWLKSGSMDGIYIGTDPDACDVYVKWEDKFVSPTHARLTYENGNVIIKPISGAEVLINDNLIRDREVLQDGDIIKLGHESISEMRFIAKATAEKNNQNKKVEKEQKESKVAVRIQKKNIN